MNPSLPNATESFKKLNPHIFGGLGNPEAKNSVQVITAPRNGIVDKMNKTEREFSMVLEAQKRKGEILRWEYQGMTLRWFDMKYTPDFVVFDSWKPMEGKRQVCFDPLCKVHNARPVNDKILRLIEVKGPHIHYRQQAVARFKGARGFWPEFSFELWQQQIDKQWKRIY